MKKLELFVKDMESRCSLVIKNYRYYKKYISNAFSEGMCKNAQQFEASITRLYHTIEKGLSYLNYRPGFGKENVKKLVAEMSQYAVSYDVDKFFYKAALSVLNEYVRKNKEYGFEDGMLEEYIKNLPGNGNSAGGIKKFAAPDRAFLDSLNYSQMVKSRCSIRHFSKVSVDIEKVIRAIQLAQFTPSACNRQGWRSRVVISRDKINVILHNQNGNRGFGEEIDKLIVVTGDLRYFNLERELYQVFIDGGMYAMSVLNALYYEGIASVPLSASLTNRQEGAIRHMLEMDEAEMFILFIGVGNYPEECQTARSERRPADVSII